MTTTEITTKSPSSSSFSPPGIITEGEVEEGSGTHSPAAIIENKDHEGVSSSSSSSSPGRGSSFYIDPEAERRVLRKFDLIVIPQFVFILILSYLDRTNIGNARIFGLEASLHLTGNQFANITSLYYPLYVLCEVPWVLAAKKYGCSRILSLAMICWSATVLAMGFAHNYGQAVAIRLLLGFFEGGIFPAMTYVISTVYPRAAQGKRIGLQYGAIAISGAFGGLVAYGVQLMGDRLGLEAWRWLFVIEGSVSMAVGVGIFFSLPRFFDEAWFLTGEEKELMRERRRRDAAYAGEEEGFDKKYVWMALTDPVVWVASLSLFCAGIPMFGYGLFLPTIIEGLGYKSLEVNLLTIPVYVVACIILAVITTISDKLRKRAVVAILVPVIVITGYAVAIGSAKPGVGLFAMFLCSAVYSYNTLLVAWVSNNIKPDHKRGVALPFFVSIANISGAVSGQVYPDYTSPRFILGNAVSLSMEFVAGCGIVIIYIILSRRNKAKDKQRAEGITDNGETDDKSLDFEYIL